jgi:hypothetical protein
LSLGSFFLGTFRRRLHCSGKQVFDPHPRGHPPDAARVCRLLQIRSKLILAGHSFIFQELQHGRALCLQGLKRGEQFVKYFLHNLFVHIRLSSKLTLDAKTSR